MPLDSYGVLVGTLTGHHRDTPDDQGRWFHVNLDVTAPAGRYRCAVDVDSKHSATGVEWRIVTVDATQLAALVGTPDGFRSLAMDATSGAVDYIRHPALRGRTWQAGSNVDAAAALESILVVGARIAVFGEPFTAGRGVHNIHQNQGDPKDSQWYAENGIWQDGATAVCRPDGRYDLFLSKFRSQSYGTDDLGHPVRTAVVTGGMSGLGAAAAERLAADGVTVLTLDIADGADLRVDVTDAAAVQATADRLGPVDILVNSAGVVGPNAPLWEITPEGWERTFAVNVTGTVNTCRAFVAGMRARGWGRVVNIASIAGKDGNPNMAPYSASKAAVIALTKSLGKELATSGVLANAIAPAVIETPMNADTAPETLAYMASLIPMKRLGRAGEVAELVAWLASDRVSFSTGAVYDISGGRATY